MGRISNYRWIAPVYDWVVARPPLMAAREASIHSLRLRPGQRLIVPGVGTGLDLPFLPRDVDVVAGDITPEMLRYAQRRRDRLGLARVELRPMDAQRLDFPDAAFDAAALHLIVAVAQDGRAVLREACRVVRPGGRIAVLDKFLPEGAAGPSLGRRLFNAFAAALATDVNRRLSDLAAGLPVRVVEDIGVYLGGNFRRVLLARV